MLFRSRVVGTGPGARVGLTSMADRAAVLGGTCTITSRLAKGTRISVRLPLAADSD